LLPVRAQGGDWLPLSRLPDNEAGTCQDCQRLRESLWLLNQAQPIQRYPSAMPRAEKTAPRKAPAKKTRRKIKGDCVIPPRVPNAAINQFAFSRNDTEADRIAEYVESPVRDDKEEVTFLAKVKAEHVMGVAYNCWNVHTNKRQWWVIDGYLTNLYLQKLFP
jgi:hypothetical protein